MRGGQAPTASVFERWRGGREGEGQSKSGRCAFGRRRSAADRPGDASLVERVERDPGRRRLLERERHEPSGSSREEMSMRWCSCLWRCRNGGGAPDAVRSRAGHATRSGAAWAGASWFGRGAASPPAGSACSGGGCGASERVRGASQCWAVSVGMVWGEPRSRSVHGGGGAHGERRVGILEKNWHFAFRPCSGMRRKSGEKGGEGGGGSRGGGTHNSTGREGRKRPAERARATSACRGCSSDLRP